MKLLLKNLAKHAGVKRFGALSVGAVIFCYGGVAFAQTSNQPNDGVPTDALSITALVPETPAAENPPASSENTEQDSANNQRPEDEIGDLISLVDAVQDENSADNATPALEASTDESTENDATDTAQSAASLTQGNTSSTRLNRIGRRQVSQVGLATIGLSPDADLPPLLNSMIWSKTKADDALFLIKNTPPISASRVLRKLSDNVITLAALPPEGSEEMVEELVMARLNWLADSGQSDKLSKLTRLLPDRSTTANEDKWAEYKQWQVDYDLIRRADDSACTEAIFNAQQSFESFWHKAKITCYILAGDTNAAGFAADILADILSANGEEDANFFMLADRLLGRSVDAELDLANLNALHLILMDAAHEQITLEAFETLPDSMIQASSSFRYLATNAALKTSYDSYVRGLVSAQQTQTIWRAASAGQVPAEAALADVILQTEEKDAKFSTDGLSSAYLWVGLANRTAADTDLLIVQAISAEVAAGRSSSLLPFYANLIAFRASDAQRAQQFSPEIRSDYALLAAIDKPLEKAENLVDDARSIAVKTLLNAGIDSQIEAQLLRDAEASDLWPVLASKGAVIAEQNWMDDVMSASTSVSDVQLGKAYVELPLATLKALEQASQNGAIAQTILLASHLISDFDLGWISPDDLATAITALKQIGLHDAADEFAFEALQAHLLRQHFSSSES